VVGVGHIIRTFRIIILIIIIIIIHYRAIIVINNIVPNIIITEMYNII
jgi:hypothetical protein